MIENYPVIEYQMNSLEEIGTDCGSLVATVGGERDGNVLRI
jgi:hypothetical protein